MLKLLRKVLFLGLSFFTIHSQVALSDCYHNEPLLKAVRTGGMRLIVVFAEMPDFDMLKICDTSRGKLSLLHIAAEAGQAEVVEFLVDQCNFDVNDFNNDEQVTPLHMAIIGKMAGTSRMLVRKGAQFHLLNPNVLSLYNKFKLEVEKEKKILEEDGFLKAKDL